MSNDISIWRDRLHERLTATGRSMRDVSLSAGLGPNFVHEVVTKGKEPSIGNLMAVASELDTSVSYLLGETAA